MTKIRIMPFLQKKGNRVAKGAIEFDSGDAVLSDFQLVGFTICDDKEKGLFVLFPSSIIKRAEGDTKPFFFLRPTSDSALDRLENAILDVYESMTGGGSAFANSPRVRE